MDKSTKTGSEVIDMLIGPGFPNSVTTFYGPSASGKTTFALLAAARMAAENKKSVFIDTEKGFSVERLKQISGEKFDDFIESIMLFPIKNFTDQCVKIEKLAKIAESGRIFIVIVDTIGAYYRLELNNDAYRANKLMDRQLRILSEISRKGIPVVLTEQVYDDLNRNGEICLVGGSMLRNWSKCLIELKKDNSSRRAKLVKHESLKDVKDVFFEIKEKGIFIKEK